MPDRSSRPASFSGHPACFAPPVRIPSSFMLEGTGTALALHVSLVCGSAPVRHLGG